MSILSHGPSSIQSWAHSFVAARDVKIEHNAYVMSNQTYAMPNYQQDWLEISRFRMPQLDDIVARGGGLASPALRRRSNTYEGTVRPETRSLLGPGDLLQSDIPSWQVGLHFRIHHLAYGCIRTTGLVTSGLAEYMIPLSPRDCSSLGNSNV